MGCFVYVIAEEAVVEIAQRRESGFLRDCYPSQNDTIRMPGVTPTPD